MGRPRSLRTTLIHQLLDKYQTQVVVGDKIVSPSSHLWEELFELLPKNHQPANVKAIYTEALKWWQVTTSAHNETPTDDFKVVSVLETTSDSNRTNDSTSETQQKDSIKFNVQVSYKVWNTVSPVSRSYKRKRDDGKVRIYIVLPPGAWTNVIVDAVTKKRRDIPCGWTFENNRCYYSGEEFLTIRGHCNMCQAILCGVIANVPEENQPVDIKIEILALDRRLHENVRPKNVRIGGEYADKLYGTKKPATLIRRDLLRTKASIFQRPYGRVPSANAIRCGQYRRRQKEKLSSCPYEALSYLKASMKYMNTIHFIGKDPFIVLYTSPAQLKLYKAFKRKNRFTEVTCDATAGVANKLDRPGNKKSGQIFLFTMVISDGFLVPIHQMLSELSDANWLTYWMSEWVRLSSDIPNQFTSDMSMALLNAAVRSFTSCGSVASYVKLMFALVSDRTASNEIPHCFVRIDIAHFMKAVTGCEALKSSPKKVRDFFIRCLAMMMNISDIEEARQHILSVIIVASSKTEGNSETTYGSVPCEIHKGTLVRKITGDVSSDENIERADTVDKSLLMETEEETILRNQFEQSLEETSIISWLKSIETEAKLTISNSDDGDRDNLMYNPTFVKYFIDLCKLYPLWSGICCQFFRGSQPTASSAKVESHIKVVKQSMADVIPCSVDKFVQENMDMVEGLIIEASQDYIRFTNEAEEMQFDSTEDHVDGETNENLTESIELHGQFDNTEGRVDKDINESLTELHDSEVNISDERIAETEDTSATHIVGCSACDDENFPSDAHKCISCGKNVHILTGCSISIGDSEGYGEKRICVMCNSKRLQEQQDFIVEMGQTEKWSRKSKREMKKSKYLARVPHWNLNNHFDRNVKIGFLTNGNMTSRLFTLNNEIFGLRNTSTFDALAQILAALFAYLPSSRSVIENSRDEIFKIAVALAKNEHMKKVNTMRAHLLFTFIYEIEMKHMMKLMLKNCPFVLLNCSFCHISTTAKIPFIPVKMTKDLSGLNGDIATSLKIIKREHQFCKGCKNVIQIKFNTNLFITLEEVKDAKLADIPEVVQILQESKILFGAILYIHPILDGDTGHYVAVIKVNASWIMFDDTNSQSHFVTGKKIFAIHSLLYTEKVINIATQAKNFLSERTANIISNETSTSKNLTAKRSYIPSLGNDKENVPQKGQMNGTNSKIPESSRRESGFKVATQSSSSGYISTSLTKIDQNIINKIGVLVNGSSYIVGNKTIRFVNTCSFDTIVQILAGACAFDESYNTTARFSGDEILQFAVLLAKSDNKANIKNMRSKILFDSIGTTNIACTAVDILSSTLKHTPSSLEILKCSSQMCINEDEVVIRRPYLSMSFEVFQGEMDRIELAIAANLNLRLNCLKCNNKLSVEVTRVFGEHLFIEMPISSLEPQDDIHEKMVTYKTDQLKSEIHINDNYYSLFGLILFQPPLLPGSVGHYVAAIKVKSSFIIFDDMRKKPYYLNENEDLIIHALFYKQSIQGDEEDSSFCVANSHTDDSLYRLYHNN